MGILNKKVGGTLMKAKVNEGCIACGMCVSLCPEAKDARDGCPVSVIDLS